jgi:opacity protein-like surface antigen
MTHRTYLSRITLILAVFGAGAPCAQAQQAAPADHFWYIGGDLGYARDKFSTTNPGWRGTSSNNATVGLRGGYQFSRYLSVESTLSSLGSVDAQSDGRKEKFTIGAWSASVVGHMPISERFSLLGIAGVGWEFGRRRGDVESSNRSAGVLSVGVGAAYAISSNWRARAQYANYGKLSWKGSNDAAVKSHAFTLGLDYMFR